MSNTRDYKLLVSICLTSYIFVICLRLLPQTAALRAFASPARAVMQYTGLWPKYRLFTPPLTDNLHLTADVKFADGSATICPYPTVKQMSLMDKFLCEPPEQLAAAFIKHLNTKNGRCLRPDLARFVARMYRLDLRRPVQVTLVQHRTPIPAPPECYGQPLSSKGSEEILLEYKVKESDLL